MQKTSKQPTAAHVANVLLYLANNDGEVITNLKMQKLLYYAQAWYLVNHGEALFNDPIEAWNLGPVVPSTWKTFNKFGSRPIEYKDEKGKEFDHFSNDQKKFLVEFYDVFIKYSAHVLVNMTHNEDPWKNTPRNGNIDLQAMKIFYLEQYEKSTNLDK